MQLYVMEIRMNTSSQIIQFELDERQGSGIDCYRPRRDLFINNLFYNSSQVNSQASEKPNVLKQI
jgi:hypothetical protein